MNNRAAIFIDRDGTINEEVGYLDHPSRLKLFPWSAEAIRLINGSPFKAVLVTNQSGVARGYFTEELVEQIHEKLQEELAKGGAKLDAIYYCPHHPDFGPPQYRQDCSCRKPKTGLLERAARDLNLELSNCYVIGDKYIDVQMAHRAGARAVLVLSGYGLDEYKRRRADAQTGLRGDWPREPDFVAENLLEAVKWILERWPNAHRYKND